MVLTKFEFHFQKFKEFKLDKKYEIKSQIQTNKNFKYYFPASNRRQSVTANYHEKDIVKSNLNELKTKIQEAIRVINEDTLKRVFKNMKIRLNFVRRTFRTYYELNNNFNKQSTLICD